MSYLLIGLVAFVLSIFFTEICRRLAIKLKIFDDPSKAPQRKIHQKPIPFLGGLSLYLSFFITLIFIFFLKFWPSGAISLKYLIGFFVASTILVIGGVLDEKKDLKPIYQLLFSILAIIIVIASGIGIKYINNPFGSGLWFLEQSKIELTRINGIPYYFSWPADLLTFAWLFIVIYAIKLLTGLDGLVPGIVAIGAIIIFCFSIFTVFIQPQISYLSIILFGVCLGFLLFDFYPAKIFLGTSGEMFLGFSLGVLAIISGSKIATILLVLSIPILDLFWVIFRRIFKEKKSPMIADRKHLHYRLLDSGFSHRGAVIFLWALALIFGLIGIIFPETKTKIIVLTATVFLMFMLACWLSFQKRRITVK